MAAGVLDGHKCAELIIKSGADVNAQNEVCETFILSTYKKT